MHKSLTLEIKKVMFYNFHRVPGHLLFDGGWNKGYLQGVFRGFYRCSFHVMVRAIYFVSSQSHPVNILSCWSSGGFFSIPPHTRLLVN